MGAISRLFRPLDYARIKHPAKTKYDIFIPLSLAVFGTAILMWLPKTPNIIGTKGLIEIFSGLLQILTGFYIASLAAIATFNKDGMDETMAGDPPTLTVSYRGKIKIDKLTRRRFLCLMFGYLALMSIFIYFLGQGTQLFADNAKILIPSKYFYWCKWSFVSIYLFFALNLIVTTLLSLFYMVDHIHRHNPTLTQRSNVES